MKMAKGAAGAYVTLRPRSLLCPTLTEARPPRRGCFEQRGRGEAPVDDSCSFRRDGATDGQLLRRATQVAMRGWPELAMLVNRLARAPNAPELAAVDSGRRQP